MPSYGKSGLKNNVNELPDFSKVKQGSATIWVERSLTSPAMMDSLANVDAIIARPDRVIVKDEKKIRVARVSWPTADVRAPVYIKRYNCFSLRYRIQSLFCRSGAVRALRGAAILRGARIATARPVAAVEVHRWGTLESSFYISEELIEAKTTDAYWRENLKTMSGAEGFHVRRRFLADLSGLFRRLHAERIYHNDLKDYNILVRPNQEGKEQFFVVDLEGVRRCRRLSMRRRVKNLVQLNRTLGQFLSRPEKLVFLNSYLANGCKRQQRKPTWVRRILVATAKAGPPPVDSPARNTAG
jgi:serine/threonine protein kinase